MSEGATAFVISQIGYLVPVMLVYVFAFVMGLIYLRQEPVPATLTLVGSALLVVVSIGFLAIQTYLIHSRDNGNIAANLQWLGILGIASSILRSVGLAILITAIFVGRGKAAENLDLAAKTPR